MARRKSAKPVSRSPSGPIVVRMDAAGKAAIVQAAKLRRISLSDYVRTVTVAQARREVEAAPGQTIVMSPDEQLTFWMALKEVPVLTAAQRKLGDLMRGKV